MFSRKTKSLTSPDKVASWIGGTTLVHDSSGIFDDAKRGEGVIRSDVRIKPTFLSKVSQGDKGKERADFGSARTMV